MTVPPPRPSVLGPAILSVVADIYATTPDAVVAPSRSPIACEARAIAAQLLYERGLGASAIGRVLGRDHATVLHALTRLETALTPEQWDMLQTARRALRERIEKGAA